MQTRILIVDDHSLFRTGLRQMLDGDAPSTVCGEAANGRDALALLTRIPADLMITDLVMPVLNGIDTVRMAMADHPQLRALIVSGYAESRFVGPALEAGASGFVPKTAGAGELRRAIRVVMDGRSYLSPQIADMVVQRYVRHNGGDETDHPGANGRNGGNGDSETVARMQLSSATALTPREREILQLLAEGHATKQVAAQLSISAKTVDTHRAALMRKLKLDSVAHLTKYAIREGITTLDF